MEKVVLILIIIHCLSCSPSINKEKLEKSVWKYGEGFYLGDLITFGKGYKYMLKSDSVYYNAECLGIILSSSDEQFVFISEKTGEKGIYSFLASLERMPMKKEQGIPPRE